MRHIAYVKCQWEIPQTNEFNEHKPSLNGHLDVTQELFTLWVIVVVAVVYFNWFNFQGLGIVNAHRSHDHPLPRQPP